MLVQLLFYGFSLVLLAAALGVITLRNPVHSALCLVLTFFTAAAIWLLVEAEFLAIVLVLVYVGAVMLFLFVVMMLDINIEELRSGFTKHVWLGAATAAVLALEIIGVVVARGLGSSLDMKAGMSPSDPAVSNATELGTALYTRYTYPFELAAVLLLVAIIAAIVLTLRQRKGLKVQDIGAQVATRREDRVRVLKMPSETRE
jgi:NADH-quinone oxidoreductase subunit J